ncbi:MAG: glycogen/starch/alpha-glucan family phosphorylase, partial [Clostridia bacterium]|nr:glycogen/starch/alpha-glucan family phosphorylase [Clostridia bacterium]
SEHLASYKTLENLSEKVAFHINDTHPALVIPELMRILLDEHSYSWERGWEIVTKSVSYTNHTVMPEALERWREDIFSLRLPRIHSIIKEINERFARDAWRVFTGDFDAISNMCILANGEVRMASLSIIGSHSVNGVSKLHSSILKKSTFKNFYKLYPERFTSVTNGVDLRRWLTFANPRLDALLLSCVGDYRREAERLADFKNFIDDKSVLCELERIKYQNKCALPFLSPDSIFDVQIKRLHEYKRQLLNALNIISLYLDILENPEKERQPISFIFGAKAAPGYYMAKRIIKLIWCLGCEIEKDERANKYLKVIFLEDYKVSLAEKLIPASEISEQISLAGKEASGTGCMKLMMNGAITIGTLDGANVEMKRAVGEENIYIFGLSEKEVERIRLSGYSPSSYYSSNNRLSAVINRLTKGFFGESFSDIASYLISSDPYMCLADFESYRLTHQNLVNTYKDKERFNRISLMNIASSHYFTSDRAIEEYAKNIWGLK